jgi:hypothetical protein
VLTPGSLTPAQAAKIMHDDGTYGDWVEDVPIQGPTDRDIRTAGCWWKNNVLDKATDSAGRIVPQWTQNSLCIGNRMMSSGIGGVGEAVRRGGALGAAPAASPPPGIWSKLADAESNWISTTLVQLNALILKSGNKPCATWPADPTKAMPAAVACFQGWYNANVKPGLSTDGTLDRETLCALIEVTKNHAADFPTPYPGTTLCLSTLSMPMKIGIGVAAAAVVGGTIAAIAAHGKKKRAPVSMSEAIRSKNEFHIGQPVETTMGVRRTGKVIGQVPKHEWSDGTYRFPEPREHAVWVRWSDGTKGWSSPGHLRRIG